MCGVRLGDLGVSQATLSQHPGILHEIPVTRRSPLTMADVSIATTLDCRGLVCPLPVVKLSAAIKAVPVGAVIEMLATDPGATADLEAYQRQTGHALLEHSESNGVLRFLIRRGK